MTKMRGCDRMAYKVRKMLKQNGEWSGIFTEAIMS